ncbi:c-type cytochrome [Thalassobaculum sp. OXR-137]|uniref:c-type cytochrome n=1 Tax=Thalassobaculum sp. OXR-137 TaxID=3100173 RepID=UPI002AC9D714|nr:c-type cytochrome [Thalassobaculum sp. OXR-137]WPZ35671.1 c-type cytochrome [Thalassobaculum sp. OXR-137]
MRDPKTARQERRARFEQRLRGRIPKTPARTLDPARRLGRLAEEADEAPDQAPPGLIGRVANRLGAKGRFLAAAIVIGGLITAADLYWERYTNEHAVAADHTNAALVGLGHTLYDQHCAFCHGADLAGKPGWDGEYPDGGRPPLPLDGTSPIWRLTDRDLFDVTKYGGQPFSPASYRNAMPAFDSELADADIWAILAFIKSRWPEEARTRQKEAAAAQGS